MQTNKLTKKQTNNGEIEREIHRYSRLIPIWSQVGTASRKRSPPTTNVIHRSGREKERQKNKYIHICNLAEWWTWVDWLTDCCWLLLLLLLLHPVCFSFWGRAEAQHRPAETPLSNGLRKLGRSSTIKDCTSSSICWSTTVYILHMSTSANSRSLTCSGFGLQIQRYLFSGLLPWPTHISLNLQNSLCCFCIECAALPMPTISGSPDLVRTPCMDQSGMKDSPSGE